MRTLVALAILQLFSLTCLAADAVSKTSTWQRLGSGFQSMVSYQAVETCRSSLECVQRGCRYTHCSRVAFRRSTKHCYLLPVTQAQSGGTGDDVIIFEQGDSLCALSDAPVENAEVMWRHTLTSLDGDVTCHPSHVWTTNDTSVNCSADGVWRVGGECKQKYWINPVENVHYFLPMTPRVGWKVCANGTPSADAWAIFVNLYDANNDRPLVVLFRLDLNETQFFAHKNGIYKNSYSVSYPAYPLKQSVPFSLKLVASSEFAFNVYLNGVLHHSQSAPTDVYMSLTTIINFRFWGTVVLHDLDLWCA